MRAKREEGAPRPPRPPPDRGTLEAAARRYLQRYWPTVAQLRKVLLRRLPDEGPPAVFARVRADVEDAFAAKRDPQTGRPWANRKESLRLYLHPLLVKTGKLKAEALNAAVAATVSGNRLAVRQTVPVYAGFHQLGTRLMPRRPFLGVSRATRQWLARRLKDEAVRAFRDRSRGAY